MMRSNITSSTCSKWAECHHQHYDEEQYAISSTCSQWGESYISKGTGAWPTGMRCNEVMLTHPAAPCAVAYPRHVPSETPYARRPRWRRGSCYHVLASTSLPCLVSSFFPHRLDCALCAASFPRPALGSLDYSYSGVPRVVSVVVVLFCVERAKGCDYWSLAALHAHRFHHLPCPLVRLGRIYALATLSYVSTFLDHF